ncbi:hypothetical protein [Nitrobacter hamburgensis]|jgi:hypothetical protein|nr:hypothetical protein [Nitrobacter hamburgensis]
MRTFGTVAIVFMSATGITCLINGPAEAQAVRVATTADGQIAKLDHAKLSDWYARWKQYIDHDARSNRFCDKEMGEQVGWLISPYLSAFYYGYLASKDPHWVDMLQNWADSWIRRAVREPDGFPGWPKVGGIAAPVENYDEFYADSMLGEAMALRPLVLMSAEILKTPALKAKYGDKAQSYIDLSEQIYAKWDSRGAWRDADPGGGISIVLPFGIDQKTGGWTEGYKDRHDPHVGFSHPDNKANLVGMWLLAMYDATGKSIYRERAEKWFRLMKSRMKPKADGTFEIWSYWSPAGPWDYKSFHRPKHWVGVHPNPGYYAIDVEAIVIAYQHDVVFTKDDIDRLIATSHAEKRSWAALIPYDMATRRQFEDSLKPDSWAGLGDTPWYLALQIRQDKIDR